MADVRGYEILQEELERAKYNLKDVNENIKRLTGRDPIDQRNFGRRDVAGGDTRGRGRGRFNQFGRRSISDEGPASKRRLIGGAFERLGVRPQGRDARRQDDSPDEDETDERPAIQSAVIAAGNKRTRKDMMIEQTEDKKGMARNRRMFGHLLGTLQTFRQEAKVNKDKEEHRKEIEQKLEEKAKSEKMKLQQEKKVLEHQLQQEKAKIGRLEQKMEIVNEHDMWEQKTKLLENFICTTSEPRIFYLPKSLNAACQLALKESTKIVEQMIVERRLVMEREIEELMQLEQEREERIKMRRCEILTPHEGGDDVPQDHEEKENDQKDMFDEFDEENDDDQEIDLSEHRSRIVGNDTENNGTHVADENLSNLGETKDDSEEESGKFDGEEHRDREEVPVEKASSPVVDEEKVEVKIEEPIKQRSPGKDSKKEEHSPSKKSRKHSAHHSGKTREKSREKTREKTRENSREKTREKTRETSREKSREKVEVGKDEEKMEVGKDEINNESPKKTERSRDSHGSKEKKKKDKDRSREREEGKGRHREGSRERKSERSKRHEGERERSDKKKHKDDKHKSKGHRKDKDRREDRKSRSKDRETKNLSDNEINSDKNSTENKKHISDRLPETLPGQDEVSRKAPPADTDTSVTEMNTSVENTSPEKKSRRGNRWDRITKEDGVEKSGDAHNSDNRDVDVADNRDVDVADNRDVDVADNRDVDVASSAEGHEAYAERQKRSHMAEDAEDDPLPVDE